MPAVDETAERKLSAKVSRPILSCKHGSWDTWNVLMKNYINVHDGWNEIVFENRLKDVAKKRLPSKPRKPSGSGQPSLYTGKELLADQAARRRRIGGGGGGGDKSRRSLDLRITCNGKTGVVITVFYSVFTAL